MLTFRQSFSWKSWRDLGWTSGSDLKVKKYILKHKAWRSRILFLWLDRKFAIGYHHFTKDRRVSQIPVENGSLDHIVRSELWSIIILKWWYGSRSCPADFRKIGIANLGICWKIVFSNYKIYQNVFMRKCCHLCR